MNVKVRVPVQVLVLYEYLCAVQVSPTRPLLVALPPTSTTAGGENSELWTGRHTLSPPRDDLCCSLFYNEPSPLASSPLRSPPPPPLALSPRPPRYPLPSLLRPLPSVLQLPSATPPLSSPSLRSHGH